MIKQGTPRIYTQENLEGEIKFIQTIPMCVSIIQLVPLYKIR